MLDISNKAPQFVLPSQSGDVISLESLLGKYIVLYFYPKDDTPGCTKEACFFRDDFQKYMEKNIVIVGVSKDSVGSHKKFVDKYNLQFLLLSDESGEVCQKYGVWKERFNFGKKYFGIERTTFIINPSGIIQKIFKRVKVDGHSNLILQFFNEL